MEVKAGDVLAGKYRVDRVLGQGGMGVVVAATHLQLEQVVAIKFLLPEARENADLLARFSREARAAARLRGDHVARVIDVGTFEDSQPYIVMEYLEGLDLSDYVKQRGPMPVAQAAQLVLQACEGLAEAHALGIVHRDLKPANLFLARSADGTPCLKILDFGISKMAGPPAGDFSMTKTGAVMGSPYYMSPEQMRSTRAVDARSDIWSLGVILYELVAGKVPFDAPSLPHLCAMILSDPLPPLRLQSLSASPRFEALLLRCLEKAPEQRFQNVAELAAALVEFAPAGAAASLDRTRRFITGSTAGSAEARPAAPPVDEAVPQGTHAGWGRTAQRARSRGLWIVLGTALLVGGAAAWTFARRSAPTASPASPLVTAERQDTATPRTEPAATVSALPTAAAAVEATATQAPQAPSTVAPPALAAAPKAAKPAPRHASSSSAAAIPSATASATGTPAATAPSPGPAAANPLDGRL